MKWKVLKDEQPAKRGHYLVSDGDEVLEMIYIEYLDGVYYFETYRGYSINATHWMELPDPPEILSIKLMPQVNNPSLFK